VAELERYLVDRQQRARLADLNAQIAPAIAVSADRESLITFPAVALKALEFASWARRNEPNHPWIARLADALVAGDGGKSLDGVLQSCDQAIAREPLVREVVDSLKPLGSELLDDAFGEPLGAACEGRSIAPWLAALRDGLDALESLVAFESQRRDAPLPMQRLIDALTQTEPTGDRCWSSAVQIAALSAWRTRLHREQPLLATFTPEVHEAKTAELARRLAQKRELESAVILRRWQERQVARFDQPWRRIFQLRRSRHGQARRLREAVGLALPLGLLDFRPCWLVSPASASEVLPLAAGLFDVVIFDEASQCPVEQAAPSIFRGKSLLVSGDEKQLPPTSFFSARSEGDDPPPLAAEEDGDEDATDVPVSRVQRELHREHLRQAEDLLSAVVGNLPEERLRVHYRSRDPALVEFSNHAFYSGSLEAPPCASSDATRPAIEYHHVEGTYENRTNAAEAKRVVELVKSLWREGEPSPTVGVVTFNHPQRELIEDLFEEECERDAAFGARFDSEIARRDNNQDVGFFVKNLENVQGDERDVMLFSTTFGRDAQGRFYRRFGPVGALGGERRLNVAVTRAKERVIIVGGMPLADISSALGVDAVDPDALTPKCFLQLYLAYAMAVSSGDTDAAKRALDRLNARGGGRRHEDARHSPLVADVRRAIEELGYPVHECVGDAGFSIALAVPSSQRSGYLLGIDCDGGPWLPGRSARLREVWRTNMLAQRSWRLHRIWSSRWWYDRPREVARLKQALLDAERIDTTG
jgi:hypothetical protein